MSIIASTKADFKPYMCSPSSNISNKASVALIHTTPISHRSILPNHPPRKLPKRQSTLHIHDFLQIRLREHRQSIPRNPHSLLLPRQIPTIHTSHKVRHCLEPALRYHFKRFACLKRQAVAWDRDFVGLIGAGADVEACGGRGRGYFGVEAIRG